MEKFILFALIFSFTACSSISSPRTPDEEHLVRNEGYSLLYALVSKESDVAKILIFKRTSPAVAVEIKRIARNFTQAKQQLDAFAKNEPGPLTFKEQHLPLIEEQAREAESKTESKTLLFSSGKKFERELLQTQIQSLGYAWHLAGQIAVHESDPKRKFFLEQFGHRCELLHHRVLDLLAPL